MDTWQFDIVLRTLGLVIHHLRSVIISYHRQQIARETIRLRNDWAHENLIRGVDIRYPISALADVFRVLRDWVAEVDPHNEQMLAVTDVSYNWLLDAAEIQQRTPPEMSDPPLNANVDSAMYKDPRCIATIMPKTGLFTMFWRNRTWKEAISRK